MVKLSNVFLTTLFVVAFGFPSFCTVTQTSNPAVVGCADNFSTTVVGTNYQWDFGPNSYYETVSGTAYQSASTVFLSAGTRTVMVTVTTGGGPVIDSLVVTVQPSASNISLSADAPPCENKFITYTATPGSYTRYEFFVNDSLKQDSTINIFQANLPNGDSVRVFGLNGICFSNPSAAIVINTPSPPQLTSTVANDTICGNQLVVFTATPATYDTFFFYVGGSLQQESASNTWSTTQLYNQNAIHVTVLKNGCVSIYWSNIDTFTVKPTPSISISLARDTICKGTPVTVSTDVTQATADSIYFLVNSLTLQDDTAGTYTSAAFNNNDTITAISEHQGCFSKLSNAIVMTVNPLPPVTLTSSSTDDTICQGTPVTFTAAPTGYDSYDFFNGTQSVQNGPSSTYITGSLTNGSTITVVVTNAGCTGPPSDTIPVVVFPLPAVSAGPDMSDCANSPPDTLTGFSPAGGTWNGTGITNDTLGVFDPAVAGVGTHSLAYTFTNPNTGCTGSDTMLFTVNPLPVITVNPPNPSVCQNQQIPLTATGADVYSWSPGATLNDSLIPNPVASPVQTTAYTVTGISNATGCSNSTAVTVSVTSGATAGFTFSQACQRQATDFTNTTTPANGTTYQWYFGDGAFSDLTDPTHNYFSSDTFNVTLIARSGNCFDTVTQPVFVYPAAQAAFDAFPLYSYNDSNSPVHFINQSTGAQSYTWDFGDQSTSAIPSPYHHYSDPGLYTITLTASNQYGCNDSLTKVDYITIYQAPIIFVPNAFTPAGAYNNILHIFTPGANFVDFKIFDRIGELVYLSYNVNSGDVAEGWNGKYRGHDAPAGVYVYVLEIVFDDNTSRKYEGSITLLR